MAVLTSQQKHHRWSWHTGTPAGADRLGVPAGTAHKWHDPEVGDVGLQGNPTVEQRKTENKYGGFSRSAQTKRNEEPTSLSVVLFPDEMGSWIKAAFELLTSPSLPPFFSWQTLLLNAAGDGNVIDGLSNITGTAFEGCIVADATLAVDFDEGGIVKLELNCLVNAERSLNLTATIEPGIETPTFPAGPELTAANFLVDFAISDSAGDFPAQRWGGKNENVKSVSISNNWNLSPKNFAADSDDALNGTWNRVKRGDQELTVEIVVATYSTELVTARQGSVPRKLATRLAWIGPTGDVDTTSGDTITTAGNTLNVADGSNTEDGDVLIIQDPTAGTFQVMTISSGGGTNSLTFTENFLMDMDGSTTALTVKNQAGELKIPRSDLSQSNDGDDDGEQQQTLSSSASPETGETGILFVQAYDDNA